jgi:periplasmic divalent cation tolerance protein
MEFRTVYITFKDQEEARRLGRKLVEERLVACVNILPGIESLYWWQGAIQADREAALLAKTTAKRMPAVIARIREWHSYEVPCIVSWPLMEANPAYLRWVEDETTPHA